ncbi:nucleic acid-binding, OB-fold protein [Artemisia annua]|uniref:Nucleic acid-binding, OB-fold protein n=1 Tax=Artemisia annua TaxID=35608 RepID=A0A2U1NCU1_ARTAN|nr:nucleic acid-binding, OB-fold protein [Artemisia annua]
MKIKRKVVPNETAGDIPVHVSQSLGSQTVRIHEVSGSTSVGHSGVSHIVDHGTMAVSCPVVSSCVQGDVATSPIFSDVANGSSLPDIFGMETGQPTGGHGILSVSQNVQSNSEHLLVPGLPHPVNLSDHVPAQVPTVNGLVSNFQITNIARPLSVPADQSATSQGVGYMANAHRVPMLLDFSLGTVVREPHPTISAANTRANFRRSTMRRTSRRRTGNPTMVGTRQRTPTGQSYMDVPHGPPVQGPVAPTERQGGAPSDYRRFGRCDQVCQHCRALFWLEERRTGLPMSAAPQYQRCCAAGRAFAHQRQALRETIIEGLIGFLNDNNALVKLFRTARDKLREADIPNFSIRLFGVVGANQYELPTGDNVGAIVYEGGPETMTDYDVVIQRHSGEPESEKAIVCPKNETVDMINEKVMTNVQAEGRNYTSNDEATPKMNDGGTSSKSADNPVVLCRQLAYLTELNPADNSKFIEVRVYRKWTAVKVPGFTPIGFSCMLLDKKGTAIQANADLKDKERFERDLQINSVYKIQGFGFDKADTWGKTLDNDIILCLGKYTQVDLLQDKSFPYHYFNFAAFNELNARLEKKNPILTDYIGYVHNVEKVKEYGGATTSRVKVRNIGIRNLKYNEANAVGPQLEVQTERLTNWEQERNRNRVPLATLLQIDPKTQQRVLFTQDAMILQVDTSHDWYYQKCDECGGKLRYGYLHGQCHQYGTKPKPENSYCFRIVITDGTGNALMSCFTPQTDGLIKDVNTLLQEVDNKDPQTIPAAILALQNTKHIFQFQFATPPVKGPPTFVLKKIMDNPQIVMPEPSAAPSPSPTNLPEMLMSDQSTPPPPTPTATQDTPIEAPTVPQQSSHSTARKELFAETIDKENDRAPKKQKKD